MFATLLILLLPVIWFSAPLWGAKLVENILVQQQCRDAVVDIGGVGWHQSHINRLYCKDQNASFELDITDADISYTLAGLMEKRVEDVSLESAALNLRTTSESNAEAIPVLTTPALLLESLPLSSFHIRHIQLQQQNQQGEVIQEIRGYARYSDQGLSVALNEASHLKGVQLTLEMNRENGVSAALSQGDISIIDVQTTMRKTANDLTVDGETDVAIAPLFALLKPWLNMSEQQMEGVLHGSWQLSLPAQSSQPLLQQLDATAVFTLDAALHRPDSDDAHGKLNLNVSFQQGMGAWDIVDGSQLRFGDQEAMHADLAHLSGSFALTASGWSAAIAENSALRLKNIRINDIHIPSAQLRFIEPLGIRLSNEISIVQEAAVELMVPTAESQDVKLASRKISLALKQGSLLTPSGSFTAAAITLVSPALSLPESNLSGTFELSDKQVSVAGNMRSKQHGEQLNWQLSRQLSESAWHFNIAEKSTLQVKNVHLGDQAVSYVNIKAMRPIAFAIMPKGAVNLVNKTSIALVLPRLQLQENSFASRGLNINLHQGSIFSPSGSFVASGIKFTTPTMKLPESNVSGSFDLSKKQLSALGKVDAPEAGVHLVWKLKHIQAKQQGLLEFTAEQLTFGAGAMDLSRIIDSHDNYAIEGGVLDLKGSVQWQKNRQQKNNMDARFDLKLSGLKGFYKTNKFSGLSGNLHFNVDEKRLLMVPAVVSLDRLDAGVPVHHISMSAAFAYPFAGLANIQINQLKAEALGGLVSSEKISIDLARASNPFLVQIKHMDAGQVAEIRRQEGLQVQGLLDGELPFDWTSDGLKMTAGVLHSANVDGLIRYLGTESVRNLAASDQATKMVMDIMHNFHYKLLNIGANYTPDGELKMNIKLKGKNPEYENGRAVELNFNIEENVLKLMQGLNMAGGIGGAVEKKVQKELRKQ
ncbi:YdbH domain-containing protein [Mariprofundus sp. EBB-1]|uniref:intermembrane phospholipid transport protein YdbH family protein n=1 Tax=Mariprofundus sp. EBB-1 TaxID=2650971 RepID=UPI0013796763|nr:YdbH domain-containing protein [Mariprofundus sp. EBB-1]